MAPPLWGRRACPIKSRRPHTPPARPPAGGRHPGRTSPRGADGHRRRRRGQHAVLARAPEEGWRVTGREPGSAAAPSAFSRCTPGVAARGHQVRAEECTPSTTAPLACAVLIAVPSWSTGKAPHPLRQRRVATRASHRGPGEATRLRSRVLRGVVVPSRSALVSRSGAWVSRPPRPPLSRRRGTGGRAPTAWNLAEGSDPPLGYPAARGRRPLPESCPSPA